MLPVTGLACLLIVLILYRQTSLRRGLEKHRHKAGTAGAAMTNTDLSNRMDKTNTHTVSQHPETIGNLQDFEHPNHHADGAESGKPNTP